VKFRKAVTQYQMGMAANKSDAELEKLEAPMKELAPKEFDLAEFKDMMNLQKERLRLFRRHHRERRQDEAARSSERSSARSKLKIFSR